MSEVILQEDIGKKAEYGGNMEAEVEQHNIDVEQILARTQRSFSSRLRARRIYEAPEFVKRLNAFEEVTAGDTVAFSCQWKALPKPTIKWYKDDQEITEDDRYEYNTEEGECSKVQVVIKNAKKSDEGAYKCKAENQEGVASTTGYLSVSGGSDNEEKTLASKQKDQKSSTSRKTPEHVSSAPFLRTIVEQYSVEEREEMSLRNQPPSPIQDFIDQAQVVRAKGVTWPLIGYAPYKDDDAGSSGSDTSVESQDFDRVTFSANPDDDDDVFTDEIPYSEMSLLNGSSSSVLHNSTNGPVLQNNIRVTTMDLPNRKSGKKSRNTEHKKRVMSPRMPSLDIDIFSIFDSHWVYFLPIISTMTFCASAAELNPFFVVICMFVVSLLVFHFMFPKDNTYRLLDV